MSSLYPGFESGNWYAMFFPKGTSRQTVARLNAEIIEVLKAPDLREFILNWTTRARAGVFCLRAPGTARELLLSQLIEFAMAPGAGQSLDQPAEATAGIAKHPDVVKKCAG